MHLFFRRPVDAARSPVMERINKVTFAEAFSRWVQAGVFAASGRQAGCHRW